MTRRQFLTWWRRWRRRGFVDSGEICRTCLAPIDRRGLWETRVEFAASPEIPAEWGGGTYGTAYWCADHRPDTATRTR